MRALTCTFVALVAVSLFSPSVRADEGGWHSNFDLAWDEAEARGKPLLVFITCPACPHCTHMKNTTLADKQVKAAISDGFVPVWIDAKTSPEAVKEIGVKAFPSTVVIMPDGALIANLTGSVSALKLRAKLAECKAPLSRETQAAAIVPVAPPAKQRLRRAPPPNGQRTGNWRTAPSAG